jgi:hypothetical protein
MSSRAPERHVGAALFSTIVTTRHQRPSFGSGVIAMMEQIAKIDRALDELLVGLGQMVLRLSSPDVTRSREERDALARSVNQFTSCAARSSDPRVLALAEQLQHCLKPRLRLVASRG